MKRILFILLLASCLTLASCSIGIDLEIAGEKDKNEPNLDTDGDVLYIVNVETRVYHFPTCYIVDNMSEENKLLTYDIEFLIEREYSPCKICIAK